MYLLFQLTKEFQNIPKHRTVIILPAGCHNIHIRSGKGDGSDYTVMAEADALILISTVDDKLIGRN